MCIWYHLQFFYMSLLRSLVTQLRHVLCLPLLDPSLDVLHQHWVGGTFTQWVQWPFNITIALWWYTVNSVSFDWFLSGLEWILNLEFLGLYLDMFDQNWSFVHKKWRFWSNIFKYRLKNSKCGRVKPRSDIP